MLVLRRRLHSEQAVSSSQNRPVPGGKKGHRFLTNSKYGTCLLVIGLFFFNLGLPQAIEVIQSLFPDKHYCGFRTYPHPLHHEGLPRLIEVFHTDDSIYFSALNDGICEPEWRGAQNFSTADKFICEFFDGTKVLSDPVPPVNPNDIWTTAIIMIRCDLPSHIAETFPLRVSLHATADLEAGRPEGPTPGSDEADWLYPPSDKLGVFQDLVVCPRKWPDLTTGSSTRHQVRNNKNIRQKKEPKHAYTLSMVTQILIEYETFEHKDRTRIQIPPINIVTWLEYNLVIGFEHFYIYDNDPQQHGPLEGLLRPYIDEGTVTYIWYPMQDCYRKSNDELHGSRMSISQAMSSTTSLRRYSHETEFMGHFDVDEYLQLPEHVYDIKTLLHEMPSTKLTLFSSQLWYHACSQQRSETAAQSTPSVFPLGDKLCVSPDTTVGKSIMRTKDILAFFVHSPWVTTNHTLFDWDKEALEVDGLFIAHFRGRRARDAIPLRIIGEPRPLVARPEWQKSIQARVGRRMSARAASNLDRMSDVQILVPTGTNK